MLITRQEKLNTQPCDYHLELDLSATDPDVSDSFYSAL